LIVEYCTVCTLPFEYCEYTPTYQQCLASRAMDSKDYVPSEDQVAEDAEEVEENKSGSGDILITRVSRTKKKSITYVKGLEHFMKLKDAVPAFKKKFACGSAVQKQPDSSEIIVIQGDVQDDLADFLKDKYEIPEDRIFFYDAKSKSKQPAF